MPTDLLKTKNEWMVTGTYNRLHYVPGYENTDEWWDRATGDPGYIEGTAACGLSSRFHVPGIFSRLGRPRCAHCCQAVGITRGDGCPINDDTARIGGSACADESADSAPSPRTYV